MTLRAPEAQACLERTRSSVLNILLTVGLGIAISGFVLRRRDQFALFRAGDRVREGLMAGLFGIVIGSVFVRRLLASGSRLRDEATRCRRFYLAHVLAAGIGALAIPLGLVYGWLVEPRLRAVAPFWVAGLALGFIAYPRRYELEAFEETAPTTPPEEPES